MLCKSYQIIFLFLSISFQIFAQQKDTTSNELIFISDTQTPLGIEKLEHHNTSQNPMATSILLHHISKQSSQNIFILGDVVGLGFKNKSWKIIDNFLLETKANNKNVYAVWGNHDVMLKTKKGVKNFEKRFTNQSIKGYTIVKDSIAVVMLNSNFLKLNAHQNLQQINWYKKQLHQLDSSTSIKSIIVCCHHSPYSNSKVVGCNTQVQKTFIQPFSTTTKCKLFLSGHSHNFEHFVINNKSFCVIGGGGGLHQSLKSISNLTDIANSYKPLYHYLSVKRESNILHLISYQLNKQLNKIEQGYTFDIAL